MKQLNTLNEREDQTEEIKEDSQFIPQSALYVHGLESGLNGSKHRPSRAAEDSLQGCLKIQEEELRKNRPDIILGSSWGGGIGLLMVSEGLWDGPIVLCCPALKYLLDKVGQTPKYKWNEIVERINQKNLGKNIIIIHGTNDKTIPYQNSLDCSQQIKDCQLITIENGDHKLNDYILKNDKLKGIMFDLYKKYKLDQLNN